MLVEIYNNYFSTKNSNDGLRGGLNGHSLSFAPLAMHSKILFILDQPWVCRQEPTWRPTGPSPTRPLPLEVLPSKVRSRVSGLSPHLQADPFPDKQSEVDFVNCVSPFADLPCPTPNFSATKSFSKVGHRAATIWQTTQNILRNCPEEALIKVESCEYFEG